MRSMGIIGILTLLVVGAGARDFHVRPAPGPYGLGNGETYADAWPGLHKVGWTQMQTSDTLLVSGLHEAAAVWPRVWKIGAAGSIRSNWPADPATLKGWAFTFDGRDGLTFSGITFDHCQLLRAKAKNVTFENCVFDGILSWPRMIEPHAGADDWRVLGCSFRDMPNAVYSIQDAAGSPDHLTVAGCSFKDIGVGDIDGHAVGIQGGQGHRVLGNHIERAGNAIVCWASSKRKMTDIQIIGNQIRDSRSGIWISGSNDPANDLPAAGWRAGVVIKDNVIDGVDDSGIRSNIRDPIEVTGNRISAAGRAGTIPDAIYLYCSVGGVRARVTGNIITGPARCFIHVTGLPAGAWDDHYTNNTYTQPLVAKPFYHSARGGYMSLADWLERVENQ